jgi:carboxyl-terminal processing protease
VTTLRIFISLLLLLTILLPTPGVARAATCEPGTAASQSLDLVQEAFEVLTLMFVERPAAPEILVPATGAARAKLTGAADPAEEEAAVIRSPSMVPAAEDGSISDFGSFSDVYCGLWTGRERDFAYDAVSYASIAAMTEALNEGHTHFLTPQMYTDHKAWQSGDVHYEGIGARLAADPLTVQHVFPDSPAAISGVQFGDRIIAIDGEPASDLRVTEAVLLIRGEGGTTVTLTVERPGTQGAWDVPIVRSRIHVPTIEARMISDIAYLRIDSFPTADLPREVFAELDRFKVQGAKALILDLRDNSGGRLDVGTQIAGYFLPENTPVYQQTTRRGVQTTATSSAGQVWNLPTVVLINGGTASMGEILASAMKEGNVATVIGSTTSGEVAGSIVVPLSDGSAVQVTTLRIDSGYGTILNNIGVVPNIEVEFTVDDARAGVDHQLDAALSHLRSRLAETSVTSSLPSGQPGQPTGTPAQPTPAPVTIR